MVLLIQHVDELHNLYRFPKPNIIGKQYVYVVAPAMQHHINPLQLVNVQFIYLTVVYVTAVEVQTFLKFDTGAARLLFRRWSHRVVVLSHHDS